MYDHTPVITPIERHRPASPSVDRPPAEASRAAIGSVGRPVRVAVIGVTGYAGGELVRLLAGHPSVEIVGLGGRDRSDEPLATSQPHLAGLNLVLDSALPEADVVCLALPHGVAASMAPGLVDGGHLVVDLGPDFRLADPAAYPSWYGFAHPAPALLARAVYGLPELHRPELQRLEAQVGGIVAVPGCYPTATLLALAPLARAGLIADLVVDAKSGVSGAGRQARPELGFAEVNESVRAYGVAGHRHTPEMVQELAAVSPAANEAIDGLEFVPHLVPMTRGILATCYVRPSRPVGEAELAALYQTAYAGEPFVQLVDAPPATKHVVGTNEARVHVRRQARSGRIVAMAVIDNLVKGAAGQAIQALNAVLGLDERTGLAALAVQP